MKLSFRIRRLADEKSAHIERFLFMLRRNDRRCWLLSFRGKRSDKESLHFCIDFSFLARDKHENFRISQSK